MDGESILKNIEEIFQEAEKFVKENYPDDLEWSRQVGGFLITKVYFMQEYAYVVYCSGYKQSIVRRHWNDLCEIYHYFSPSAIVRYKDLIREKASTHIANKKKIDAILTTAEKINPMSMSEWQSFKNRIKHEDFFAALLELPFIGPITKYHLARNLGFDTIKPDVHLQRMADHFGRSPFEMCKELSEKSEQLTGHHYPVHTIDSILWRASAERMIKWSDLE